MPVSAHYRALGTQIVRYPSGSHTYNEVLGYGATPERAQEIVAKLNADRDCPRAERAARMPKNGLRKNGKMPVCERAPAIWRVVHHTAGAVDSVLLGDQAEDSHRIGLTIVGNGEDGPEVNVVVVYPCRACGWAMACHGGEDCHS